jgi:beta-lactamase class A
VACAMTLASLGAMLAADDPIGRAAQAAESRLGARVGLAVYDTGDGRSWLYRVDDRFPMASTSKALVCAALLHEGPPALKRRVRIEASDLLSYAPVTKGLVGEEVALSDLCAAALRASDNTAINAVLSAIGGPERVTAFLRSIGDGTTRLDRNEPALNEGRPGDPRDTTTPRAMADTMRVLVLGSALDAQSRDQLTQWLESDAVGGPLLRAGVPADWRIADRTGAGGFGARGIVAVMWPPNHAPIVAAIYLTETGASMDERNDAIAAIGRAIATAVGP